MSFVLKMMSVIGGSKSSEDPVIEARLEKLSKRPTRLSRPLRRPSPFRSARTMRAA